MKCADIPDKPILRFMLQNERGHNMWANWCFGNDFDVRHAMPGGFNLPPNLVLAKMRQMIRRGVIDGCSCGCRGDFEITSKGMAEIGEEGSPPRWRG